MAGSNPYQSPDATDHQENAATEDQQSSQQIVKSQDVPKECPGCGHKFSRLLRPPRRLQRKAQMLFLFGIILTVPWAGLVCLVFFGGLDLLPAGMIIPIPLVSVVIALFIITVPGLLIGTVAYRMPRVVTPSCRQCGWSQKYLLKAP